MTNLTTRKRFELFVARALELERLRLVKQGIRAKYKLSWNADDNKLNHTSNEPDEEDLRSFLLLFRQFIANDEPIFINKIFNECEISLSEETIISELRQARAEWKKILKNVGGVQVIVDGQSLTGEYVLDLWINGYYFHNDADKVAKLEELTKGQLPLTRMQLYGALPGLTGIIIGVGHGIQKCLQEDKFVFPDESTKGLNQE